MVDRVEQMLRDCGATSVDDAPERLQTLEGSPVWPYWAPLDDETRAAVLARFVPQPCGCPPSVPERHDHRVYLRRHLDTSQPKEIVLRACWQGDYADVRAWPLTVEALTEAEAWCVEHKAVWADGYFPVTVGGSGGNVTSRYCPSPPGGTRRCLLGARLARAVTGFPVTE